MCEKSHSLLLTILSSLVAVTWRTGHNAADEMSAHPDLRGSVEPIPDRRASRRSRPNAAEQVTKDHHRLDILVNNAGIRETSIGSPPYQRLRDILTTNTIGPFLVADISLDMSRKCSSSRFVFVSSSGGSPTRTADPNLPYYGIKPACSSVTTVPAKLR